MLLRLPNAESGARRVDNHRHAAHVHHIKRFLHNCAAQGFGFCGNLVSAGNADVRRPVHGYVFHHLAFLIQGPHIFPVKPQHRVNHVRPDRAVVRGPAEKLGIELLGARAVGGRQFDPAKTAGCVLHL